MSDTTPGASKAIASGMGGALSTVVCWIVHAGFGVAVPPEVAVALSVIVGTALVWFTPHQVGSTAGP